MGECALLVKLRDELKAGNLSVRNSKRFACLDDFFIDGGRWQAMREEFFRTAPACPPTPSRRRSIFGAPAGRCL